MSKKQINLSGYKLEQIPVVLTTTEVSLILQIEEKEVIKLISNRAIKIISGLSELRIAAHSFFEFLHSEDVLTDQDSGTGFVNTATKLDLPTKVGFVSLNKHLKEAK
jgi:hypothetical protein